MKLNRTFAEPADMPATIPLFPLEGALLLPRRPLQLTIFEPRYLAMLDDALSGERLVGIIQPVEPETSAGPPPDLYPIGCAGRIVQYAEVGDGRCFMTLMGVARFRLAEEMHYATPYRVAAADYAPFAEDFMEGAGEAAVDRDSLLATLRRFAEVNEVKVAWSDIKKASNEALVERPLDDEPLRSAGEAGAARVDRPEVPRRDAGGDHHHRARPRRRRRHAAALARRFRDPRNVQKAPIWNSLPAGNFLPPALGLMLKTCVMSNALARLQRASCMARPHKNREMAAVVTGNPSAGRRRIRELSGGVGGTVGKRCGKLHWTADRARRPPERRAPRDAALLSPCGRLLK